MRNVIRGIVVAGALLAAGTTAMGAGFGGNLDGLKSDIAEDVAAGNKTAVKIDKAISKDVTSLSASFKQLSKAAKAAAKDDYATVSREQMESLFAQFILANAGDQVKVAERIVELTSELTNQKKLAKLALFIAKKLQGIEKIPGIWVQDDPDKANLAKAAAIYAKLQKAWEAFLRKYGEPA